FELQRVGRYDEALPLAERSREIRERILGPGHREVATAINAVASLYHYKGDYAKAEPLYQQALTIREQASGPEHPEIAQSLNNLASLYKDQGDFVRAESHYQRALNMWEKTLGPEHPDVGRVLNNLALLYHYKGDYAKAESLYRRALTVREQAQGPEHLDVAATLNNLALLYYFKHEYQQAEPLFRRALAIREKLLVPDHPDIAACLNNLALLYSNSGDYATAEPLFRRALASRLKALGPEHPRVASILNNLALLYHYRGEYQKAEPLYLQALEIREKALGPAHLDVAKSLNKLAMLYAAKGDLAPAIAYQARAGTVNERNLASNLFAGSERQKLAYLALSSKQTDFTLALHSRIAPGDPRALNLAFTTLLRRKARALDAMSNTVAVLRRHATPQDRALFDQLAEARSRLAAATLKESSSAKPDSYRARIKPLEEDAERLESELSLRSGPFRAQSQPVTLGAVQAALPIGNTLVEFAVYTPQEPRTEKSLPPCYLAYLLTAQGPPKWVDLGEAAPIDRAVEAWRQALRDPKRTDVKRLARAVDEKVMRPIRTLLTESPVPTRRVLIAPDGMLNLIPFAALVDEQNQYLIERYAISYLTSGRDLLRLQASPPNPNAALIVANPTFGRVATVPVPAAPDSGRGTAGRPDRFRVDSSQVFFQPLPGTEAEALAIKAVLPGATVLLREQATEGALKQASSPRILHIATHGFFLNENDPEVSGTEPHEAFGDDSLRAPELRLSKWAAQIEDPLLRSGLALAGANQGRSGDDDGVLTALEAAGLDLLGTKLVVFSACDTGVGEIKNGEGVQGLRRALVLAGSESQVMSLWPVPDDTTKDLMVPYYQALQQGEGRGEGLRRVQLQMLRSKDRRHPFYWAAFIQSGEWANLDGRR
ncbi:MAG TPA: CHAT domain-containing protein, partial [Blastocatellia bacterium]|nr:CHAT domain-containing protein [Blastocatellia bacterium]